MLKKSSWRLKGLAFATFSLMLGAAYAQDGGYHVSEEYQPDAATADAGPVRMARVSYIEGAVTWRLNGTSDWSPASVNLPIREGAQLSVGDHARAEIQFDDGSYARLGGVKHGEGGTVTLQSLYSDAKGEFTELVLNSGLMSMHLTNAKSLYQVDTEAVSVKGYGPGKFRVGEGNGVEVVDRSGDLSLQNTAGESILLQPGQSLYAADGNAPLQTSQTPPREDHWDQFVDSRDDVEFGHAANVPPNIAVCAGDLGTCGVWHPGQYGQTWYPTVAANWAPYRAGHWVFVRPFGWTWCADESWGWAPYHYGTWVRTNYGWGWVPGPAQQCWSPACVNFTVFNGRTAWCPLSPSEVHYATFGIGFGGGWSLTFSIGSVGCYYPNGGRFCEPRWFNNVQVNRVTNVYNITTINNYYGNANARNLGFVPANSRFGGGSVVASNDFGRGVRNDTLEGGSTIFAHGQGFSGEGGRVLSGPPGAHVSVESFTPTHGYTGVGPSSSVFSKQIVRQKLPSSIEGIRPTQGPLNFVRPRSFVSTGHVTPSRPIVNTPPPVQSAPSNNTLHNSGNPAGNPNPAGPLKGSQTSGGQSTGGKGGYKNPPIYHPASKPKFSPVKPNNNSGNQSKKDKKDKNH